MQHIFDIDVACEYGVEQAIMIANFQYWITHNATNSKNLHEGKYWTYNSYKAFSMLFPYWSEKQVRRILNDLIDKGVLVTARHNKKEYDNTKWYAFADQHRWLTNIPIAHLGNSTAQMGNSAAYYSMGYAQTGNTTAHLGNPIPDSKLQIVNTDINTNPKKNKRSVESDFAASAAPPITVDESSVQVDADHEKAPVAQPPSDGESCYKEMMRIYHDWHLERTGATPLIDGAQGKAMKGLISYFKSAIKARSGNDASGEDVCRAWALVLQSIKDGRVEPFLANQVKLTQLLSNITNIINQIKNGTPKQQQQNGGAATAGNASFEDIRNKFAQRNKRE